MATVNGLTAERMLEIEAASIVDGNVDGSGHLILTKHDASTIDAGSVIGPTGSPGVSQGELDTFIADQVPIGVIWDYIGTSAPNAKWLTMTGQTIASGQTTYATLWSKIPASMKSGSSIVMPDTRGRVSVGYNSSDTDFDTIGEVGGAKTHQLIEAELPNTTVTIDPPSTTVSVNPPNTSVYIDPPVTGTSIQIGTHHHDLDFNVSLDSGHIHPFSQIPAGSPTGVVIASSSPASYALGNGGTTVLHATDADQMDYAGSHSHYYQGPTGNDVGNHSHTVDIAPFSGAVDIAPFDIAVNIAPFESSALGSGTAHNNLQPYVVFMKIIKAL